MPFHPGQAGVCDPSGRPDRCVTNRSGWYFRIALALLTLLLVACGNPLKPRIDAQNRSLADAKHRFEQIRKEVEDDLRKEPDLFRAANVAAAWRDRFQTDQEKLNDAFTDLEKLNHRDNKLSLFADVDRLRESALSDATSIKAEADRWLDLKRNTSAHVERMKSDYDRVKSADLAKVSAAIEKAETDWPAKKADLDARLETLKSTPTRADEVWAEVQTAKDKPDYAALMKDEQWLQLHAAEPEKDLTLIGQLYNSRDVILEHLDKPRGNDVTCAAKVKIVRTHFTDVQNNKSETSSEDKSEEFPDSKCDSLKDDVGMDIEHKAAGAFDTETQRVPQPPGFAYMAPPGQRNQYGYWEQHNGTSVWTWLPQYLLLRELLWNHHYTPIPSYEYDGYWSARRSGTTYYGRTYSGPDTQAPSAPKYGTHGTFTTGQYAGSRYQNKGGTYRDSQYQNQGGGYRSSGYANRPSAGPSRSSDESHQFGRPPSSSPQGHSFGSGSSSGKRFGSGGGSRPRSAPSGRRFGRR
jgi:hypothetical protein